MQLIYLILNSDIQMLKFEIHILYNIYIFGGVLSLIGQDTSKILKLLLAADELLL
jgi:hypothetical protein